MALQVAGGSARLKKWLRLFCTALKHDRPRKLLVYTICIEGSHENRLKKVSAAIVGKLYVRSLEMCCNPIGEDDTRGSHVWGLYRHGLYQRKKLKKIEEPR